ncbi:MAG TPA: transcriptional regulator [Lachnospiraceae bacterium]|nr:transcriptional regulator [Lachnospiraceae bacterium]
MGSKRILTTRAQAGMVTAADVYTSDTKLVIPKGTVLKDDIIAALKERSIFAIRIETGDDGTAVSMPEEIREEIQEIEEVPTLPDPGVMETTSDNIHFANAREADNFKEFKSLFMDSVDNLKDVFNNVVVNNDEIDTGLLLSDVKSVIAKGRNSIHIFDMLQCMRGYDDVTYVHCMNVALLSNMIGRIVYPGISHEELDVLTLSGLLCDVGKMLVPEEIIMKKGRLSVSEYNIAKTHVFHGNNILKRLNLDPRIAEVAMRHHERCDGSGYPGGYRKDQIEEFSRIVAIADVYDAMTSDRVYREAICPFDVIHMFEREGILKYDVKFLLPFLHKAAQAFVNSKVMLSNGETGKVIMVNEKELSKPVVQVKDDFYDLSKDNSISIRKVLV